MGEKVIDIEKLEGWWLNYVVGQQVCKRKAHLIWAAGGSGVISLKFQKEGGALKEFNPAEDWADAGPLIEEFSISLRCDGSAGWTASVDRGKCWSDASPLKAAMLALVASKITGHCYIPTYK